MRLAVCAYQTCPVNSKDHRKILHTNIMNNLVKSALQERRVHCKHRMHSGCCQSGCKRHGMSFCNSHIKKARRIFRPKPLQPGTVRHSCCDCNHPVILCRNLRNNRGKHIGIVRFFLFHQWLSTWNIKRSCTMKPIRMFLCRLISTAFFRLHMYNHRTVNFFCLPQNPYQIHQIMSIHRSQISDSHIFKNHARNQQLFQTALCLSDSADHTFSVRQTLQRIVYAGLELLVCFRSSQRGQMLR